MAGIELSVRADTGLGAQRFNGHAWGSGVGQLPVPVEEEEEDEDDVEEDEDVDDDVEEDVPKPVLELEREVELDEEVWEKAAPPWPEGTGPPSASLKLGMQADDAIPRTARMRERLLFMSSVFRVRDRYRSRASKYEVTTLRGLVTKSV